MPNRGIDPPAISRFISSWSGSPFGEIDAAPWAVTQHLPQLLLSQIRQLETGYEIADGIARHRSAEIEAGAIVKAPAIIGPNAFVASGAYLRGGVFVGLDCIVGPACELKTVVLLEHSKIAHLSFVGDSILGARVNVEAGAMIANYRNELSSKTIRIWHQGEMIDTNVEKFGALVGDDVRIGANAVIAPGALLSPSQIVKRLELIDQSDE